jgi:FKBP-type peptidyl-prolyl cis-trans isomerase
MRIRVVLFVCFAVISLAFFACGGNKSTQNEPDPELENRIKEEILNANRNFVERESEQIKSYERRHNLEMKQTGTGLRYIISGDSLKKRVASGMKATIAYDLSLLDGTLCYSVDSKKPRTVTVDHDDLISGLHEGLKLMHLGQDAVFIIPSHLAYGLTGDNNKVPPGSALVCNLYLIDLK